jgi:hypothetical protein
MSKIIRERAGDASAPSKTRRTCRQLFVKVLEFQSKGLKTGGERWDAGRGTKVRGKVVGEEIRTTLRTIENAGLYMRD